MSQGEATGSAESLSPKLAALLSELGGRAIGFWRVGNGRLEQLAFVAAEGLDPATARAFAAATREVPLSQGDLGIVRAYHEGRPAITRASESPTDSGSGRWLRAFGALRSVAVPLEEKAGRVVAVLSIALCDSTADGEVVARLQREGTSLLDRLPLAP